MGFIFAWGKGVGAETADFGPISDFVMLLFNVYAMILVSKNPNFMKICGKIIFLC